VRDILDDHARIYVVPNGLQEDFLKPIKLPSPVAHRPIVIWVGRLDSTKNWRGFISTGRRIASERVDVALWLVGGLNSPHEEQYQLWSAAKEHRLTRNLRWFPSIEHKDMPAVYQYVAASGGCLFSTSLRESFGVAVLEGMASGCPVVVPEASALVDLVHHGETGLFYRSGNYRAASREVLRLLNDRAFHDKIAQESVLFARRYSPEHVTKQFLETLARLESKGTNEDEPSYSESGLAGQ
jgi:glycosyltransferase involved in cell wall biosynthesis